MTTPIEMIGPEKKFYGYIIGVSLERSSDDLMADVPKKMFARFESGQSTTVYEVPDIELFAELTHRLRRNAQMRAEHGDYDYEKLFIEKTANGWDV